MQNGFETYQQRMQRVVNHINSHLDDDLSLDDLAEVACLSRFHWHRVYRGITGETIHSTVRRLKLNRASQALKHSDNDLAAIAMQAGYSRVESFARAFKLQFGHTPAVFRASPDFYSQTSILKLESFAMSIQTENLTYEIKDMPSIRLAAIHHTGSYNGSTAFNKLFKQAVGQNIPMQGHQMIGLYLDDPSAVAAESLRSIAGIKIDADFTPTAPLEVFNTYAGRYAVFHYKGPYDRLGKAYDWIFCGWMPDSAEEPADHPSMDVYLNTPDTTAAEDLRTDICIPLKG
ncbi:MAG: AraC family transcriptional regulator [Rhodobacteraceae bacterium]|nr:AraC family transcriptional regulator [Paracoccaceae bacterium]